MSTPLTVQRLRQLLHYDEATGIFTWRHSGRGHAASVRAGCLNPRWGYLYIGIDGRQYRANRLAWLYVYGEWPELPLDHINRNRADDCIGNLRLATKSQNAINAKRRTDNTSGYRGVTFAASRQKWQAQIHQNGHNKFLGYFDDREAAYAVRCDAERKMFGEFAVVAA